MRRLALLFLGLSIAAPAMAGIVGRHDYGSVRPFNPFIGDSRVPAPPAGRQTRKIRNQVEDARDSGAISRRDARELRREARRIEHLAYIYGRDGLSPSERVELETRSNYLRDAVSRSKRR